MCLCFGHIFHRFESRYLETYSYGKGRVKKTYFYLHFVDRGGGGSVDADQLLKI